MSEQARPGAWIPLLCCGPWGPGLVVALAGIRSSSHEASPGCHPQSLNLSEPRLSCCEAEVIGLPPRVQCCLLYHHQ